jgi:hypothetical protein
MTIGVGKLPKVAFFFETGITIQIQAKKLSKNNQHFYLLPSAFCLLPSGTSPPTPMLGLGGEVFHSLRMLPDI